MNRSATTETVRRILERPARRLLRRRFVYACTGGILSAGAPMGLLAVRLARHGCRFGTTSLRAPLREVVADPPDYIYVGMSTAVVFTLFGYVLGRQADRLAELSETDPLTGLSNARGLFERLDAELERSRRYREPLALLFVDLDGLKRINDREGHRAGDDAIRSVADVIRSELRESDIGARWGGDEFAVLAPCTSRAAALALAERIRALIPERSTRWPLSVSVGVATLEPQMDGERTDSATLMRAADAAMYEAKRSGRDRVVVASPSQDQQDPRESASRAILPGPIADLTSIAGYRPPPRCQLFRAGASNLRPRR